MVGMGGDRNAKRRSMLATPAVALGTNLMTGMLFFSGIGYYLDHRHGDDGQAWTITGMFLGLAWCGYEVWKLVRKTGNDATVTRADDKDARSD